MELQAVGENGRSRTKGNQVAQGVHLLADFTAYLQGTGRAAIQAVSHQRQQDAGSSRAQLAIKGGQDGTHAKNKIHGSKSIWHP